MANEQDYFEIKGLSGQRTLAGSIKVGGAKNAVLKVLAASLLFKNEVTISNVPDIEDVKRILELLEDLGVVVEKISDDTYRLFTQDVKTHVISPDIAKRIRASIALTGPLLARLGKVSFPHPGGCVIGKRPIDIFLKGFTDMGAVFSEKEKEYIFKVKNKNKRLHGAEIFLRVASVGSTEALMMASVLASGVTVIKNAALEPEIQSLGEFLNQCGAKIYGLGTPTLTIEGGGLLDGSGQVYQTIPDRIEAGSFIILGALAGKDLKITNCEPDHLDSLLLSLRSAGVKLIVGEDFVQVKGVQPKKFKALDIKTHEYPGFPTDLQAPLAVFLTQTEGQSFMFETIFEGRLQYLETLNRMGANARILDSHRAIIEGQTKLFGKHVESPDLRAGLAYVLAGIIAKGETVVHNVHYIDRGYENIVERLKKVGVNITRQH
ncbi:MAG: UDP-N-acetylglucosamine 1-carboxyvinyltransferase [Candidatus Vogelbacteria bacterium]|nr:UDP-N-acetylglucosamine 1-carboxyvinyltransferase [Candidatus Vogelbacteria bacterium]